MYAYEFILQVGSHSTNIDLDESAILCIYFEYACMLANKHVDANQNEVSN